MEVYSSINVSQAETNKNTFEQLNKDYIKSGFTYKSNQILHKIAQQNPKCYPYILLLQIVKTYHLNQFQIIFLSHILSEVQPCYNEEPQIFHQDAQISQQASQIISQIFDQSIHKNQSKLLEADIQNIKKQFEEYNQAPEYFQFSMPQLKKIYIYLLVLGYAVKYYLNDQGKIKPYEQYLKKTHSDFFTSIFTKWAKKYGNNVLSTTPRKINSFYMGLGFQGTEEENNQQKGEDCQYRNYNQIVQQLIKATTEGDQIPLQQAKQFVEQYNE